MKKLTNAWNNRCPRCRQGSLFIEPFTFSQPLAMHHRCRVCNQLFEPEPGYYYGAMFLSYGLSVTILLPIALALVFYFDWTVNQAMVLIIFLGALFFFKILRFSRSLWINLLIRYNPKYEQKSWFSILHIPIRKMTSPSLITSASHSHGWNGSEWAASAVPSYRL